MTRSTVVAHIEGPVRKGTIIDLPQGVRCVDRITAEKNGSRSVLELEEIVTEEPARAIYPVLCPKCKKVFVYGVEPERFLSVKDMEKDDRDKKFFVMPGPCHMCNQGELSFTS